MSSKKNPPAGKGVDSLFYAEMTHISKLVLHFVRCGSVTKPD